MATCQWRKSRGLLSTIYLWFDSKYDVGYDVGAHKTRLSVIVYPDSAVFYSSIMLDSLGLDNTLQLAPIIGHEDSVGWVTHQLSLAKYKVDTIPTIRIAFRYISSDTTAGDWFIDNVNTSAIALGVHTVTASSRIQLTANYSDSRLNLSLIAPEAGPYSLQLFDMAGRKVLNQSLEAHAGKNSISIADVILPKGVYLVRFYNEQYLGIARISVY